MTPTKQQALENLSFGQRVAEEEIAELSRYFVRTDQWRQLSAGAADIVYGLKGSGKSALYSSLLNNEEDLREKGVLLIAGENPRGTPVFKDLVEDPPTSEQEFRNLWKLYLLQLLGSTFREEKFTSRESREFINKLETSGLLPRGGGLKALVRSALDYVRNASKPEALSGTLEVDPITGSPVGFTGKITFREPTTVAQSHGAISVDSLFAVADEALAREGYDAWLLLD